MTYNHYFANIKIRVITIPVKVLIAIRMTEVGVETFSLILIKKEIKN